MQIITPTVGRIVHYWPSKGDAMMHNKGDHVPAMITHVWGDTVNLVVFDMVGRSQGLTHVLLIKPGKDINEAHLEEGGYCTWMQHQIDQAEQDMQVPEGAGV